MTKGPYAHDQIFDSRHRQKVINDNVVRVHIKVIKSLTEGTIKNKKEMSFKNLQRQCFKSSFGDASYFVLQWAKLLLAA